MSNILLGLLLFFLSCSSYHAPNDILIEFKEDGTVTETAVYRPFLGKEKQQGSGMGLDVDMRLGPGGGNTVHRPTPNSPHNPPAPNNGEPGVPVDIPPEDPGTPETPQLFTCTVTWVNQTASEKTKYNAACSMIETIVVSAAFESSVKTHRSCNGSVGYYGTSSELGNVGTSVYNHIRAGNETRPNATATDQEMDMIVEMYRDDSSNTIGYTYATSNQIWVNRKYSDTYKPSSLGSNLFHEWLHKLGYGHSSASTSCRPYSVPYGIGTIIRNYMVPLNDDYGY